MATRIFKGPAVYGEAASTDTSNPSTGTGYRDTTITNAQIQAALKKFGTLGGSAIENEYLFRLSTLIDLIERTGILGWNAETNYITNARVIADNGIEYRALSASLNADPMTSPALWQEVRPQLAVGETLFLTVDLTPNQLGYVGTWTAQPAGISIETVDAGDSNIGTVTGSNDKSVPLLSHTHTTSGSSSATYDKTTQFRNPFVGGNANQTANIPTGSFSQALPTGRSTPYTIGIAIKNETTPIDVSVDIDPSGDPAPTIDVRGRSIKVVMWVRTA